MKLCFVLGTAAELIKVLPLIQGAQERGWNWLVVATGQSGHNFWKQYDSFKLPRARSRILFETGSDLKNSGQAWRWMLKALATNPSVLKENFNAEKAWVIVHGDTLSTLIGAIWGRRLRWPVAHVEAGLRSKNWWQPFPEEICRRLVSRLSTLHFAPDDLAFENLRGQKGQVVNTHGNSLLDAVHLAGTISPETGERPLCLVNLHRFENLNSNRRWRSIIDTTLRAAKLYDVIFVMHPQTEYKIKQNPKIEAELKAAGVRMVARMMFDDFIGLVKRAHLLISDGGSNQEETFYLGVPCLLLRETTERREGLGSTAILSHFNPDLIEKFIQDPTPYRRGPVRPEVSPTQIILDHLKARHEAR